MFAVISQLLRESQRASSHGWSTLDVCGPQLRAQQLDVAPVAEYPSALSLRQLGHDADAGQVAERLVDRGRR